MGVCIVLQLALLDVGPVSSRIRCVHFCANLLWKYMNPSFTTKAHKDLSVFSNSKDGKELICNNCLLTNRCFASGYPDDDLNSTKYIHLMNWRFDIRHG